jgi:type IV secretory pathway TraG/TraD family ATPase VirD4
MTDRMNSSSILLVQRVTQADEAFGRWHDSAFLENCLSNSTVNATSLDGGRHRSDKIFNMKESQVCLV